MQHKHFLIYKPYKMLSQFITHDRHQKNKRFLSELFDFPTNSMAVGRLDETSEGLLIITTDGSLSYKINTTDKTEKEYYAQLDGQITDDAIEKIKNGLIISINGNDYKTTNCQARIIGKDPNLPPTRQKIRDERHGPTSWISITLTEGKFRQVRKMTAKVGFPTLRLARVRIGNLKTGSMKSGDVIELTQQQVNDISL
ncbi:pseudouridine synthase [Nonlabens ponticola]|uniref:Pseudouridine synthase n=1 Tax=Nonlabens ponticola TaxID=2496866 RepID=A0A3S9MY86_9FLAO|nr:pseudouridine synthase [Nonlabens ponticola]AZQ44226.1 pseudouridine synthase [Nonlabens ponticola]